MNVQEFISANRKELDKRIAIAARGDGNYQPDDDKERQMWIESEPEIQAWAIANGMLTESMLIERRSWAVEALQSNMVKIEEFKTCDVWSKDGIKDNWPSEPLIGFPRYCLKDKSGKLIDDNGRKFYEVFKDVKSAAQALDEINF